MFIYIYMYIHMYIFYIYIHTYTYMYICCWGSLPPLLCKLFRPELEASAGLFPRGLAWDKPPKENACGLGFRV